MADFMIIDRTMSVLKKSLDLRAQKQQVIAGNIANVDTPGYSARKINFEENLRQAINSPETQSRTSHPKHFPIGNSGLAGVQAEISKVRSSNPLDDGNTVSLEEEMFDLGENQLLYEASSQILKKKLSALKYAVSDGR